MGTLRKLTDWAPAEEPLSPPPVAPAVNPVSLPRSSAPAPAPIFVPSEIKPASELAAPMIVLEEIEGPEKGRSFPCAGQETFIVGRHKDARFRLPPDDKFVSRFHFLVEVCPPSCIIVDLKSLNKTFVNGRAVDRRVRLNDGDIIRAGATKFRVSIRGGSELPREQPPRPSPVPMPAPAAIPSRKPAPKPISPEPEADVFPQGYRRIRSLAVGTMGKVDLAEEIASGRHVVVKTLLEHGGGQERAIDYFRREAKALKSLDHPRIARFHEDVRTSANGLALVMEYVEGETVAALVERDHPVPVGKAVEIACQALEGLAHAHGRSPVIVHRDLKPDNLMVGPSGVKIIDFGLAKIFEESTLAGPTLDRARGIHGFLAPELLLDSKRVGPAVDQYGAGAILYYLLTGRPPIEITDEMDDGDAIDLLMKATPARPTRPDVSPALADLLRQALEKEPSRRFLHAEQMRDALKWASTNDAD